MNAFVLVVSAMSTIVVAVRFDIDIVMIVYYIIDMICNICSIRSTYQSHINSLLEAKICNEWNVNESLNGKILIFALSRVWHLLY